MPTPITLPARRSLPSAIYGDDEPRVDRISTSGYWRVEKELAPAGSRLLADLVTGARADADNPCSLRRLDGDLVKVGTNKFGGWG